MILLDTNVVSEPMRSRPDSRVIQWLNQQDAAGLYVSTITIAEIEFGLACLPESERRSALTTAFKTFVQRALDSRVLAFEHEAAYTYGQLRAARRLAGRPISPLDAQIAAIAITHNFSVATRNVKDFMNLNLKLVNPFEHESAT